jgi:hypothetical protein
LDINKLCACSSFLCVGLTATGQTVTAPNGTARIMSAIAKIAANGFANAMGGCGKRIGWIRIEFLEHRAKKHVLSLSKGGNRFFA